jgi:hypothetical protein
MKDGKPFSRRLGSTLTGGVVLGIALVAFTGAGGCVDPKGDFENYVERTADIRGGGTPQTDSGPIDGALPDGGVEAYYYVPCLASLAFGDINRALQFRGQVRFVPDGEGGTLTLTLAPIKRPVRPDGTKGPATELGDVTGAPIEAPPARVDANGRFQAILGNARVSGEANPFSNNNIDFENGRINGIFIDEDRLCGELDGQIVRPTQADLDEPGDTCLFIRFPGPTGTIPSLTAADFPRCQ